MTERQRRKKLLLSYNPYSGSGIFKNNLDHIIERIQAAGFQAIPVRADRGVTLNEIMSQIHPGEVDRVISAGGDGTIHTCVNAMVDHDVHMPLGILPAGTANDFAYYFELPSELDAQLDIALGSRTTKADVGIVNDNCFINVTAMGAMVDVSQKTDPNLKNALGTMAYYLTAIGELPQVHPIDMVLTTPEKTYREQLYFLVVLNGESAGGFRKLSPHSSMDDGKLDVLAFRKMPIVELGPLFVEVMNGRHPENKNVLYFQTETLKIEAGEDVYADIDGEKGGHLPLEFSVLRRRLDVFVSEEGWKYDD